MKIAREYNGYVATSQVSAAGLPRRLLSEAVARGSIVQVARGLYALPDVWEDPFYVAQSRFARGTFSDGTALFLHGMTDRAPFLLTMTFPRGYNKTRAKEAGIICRSCADDALGLGLCEVRTSFGNVVRAYDVERTLCDLMRGQRMVDDQVVTPAMSTYARSADCDPVRLMDYARALGVERKMRTYLRVLL